MAGFENLKNEELETAKLRLLDTKHMIKEIRDRTEQLREEQESSCAQHQKKMNNLNNVEASQCIKLAKLDSDIANVEQVLSSRLAEQKSLVKIIEGNKKAIESTAEETESMIADFHRKCRELEDSIKDGYILIQTDGDMAVLLELAENYMKNGHQLNLVFEILCAKREDILKRRREIDEEFSRIEAVQTALSAEMKAKQEDLTRAKVLYSALSARHAALTKLKTGSLTESNP